MSELEIKINTALRVLKMAEKHVYELFLFRTFYHDSSKFYENVKANNLFNSKINAKQFLENYFNTNL